MEESDTIALFVPFMTQMLNVAELAVVVDDDDEATFTAVPSPKKKWPGNYCNYFLLLSPPPFFFPFFIHVFSYCYAS